MSRQVLKLLCFCADTIGQYACWLAQKTESHILSQLETKRLVACRGFPRFAQVADICYVFWLAHLIVYLRSDWPNVLNWKHSVCKPLHIIINELNKQKSNGKRATTCWSGKKSEWVKFRITKENSNPRITSPTHFPVILLKTNQLSQPCCTDTKTRVNWKAARNYNHTVTMVLVTLTR